MGMGKKGRRSIRRDQDPPHFSTNPDTLRPKETNYDRNRRFELRHRRNFITTWKRRHATSCSISIENYDQSGMQL